ncbi:hypothetical protein [Paenibacillus sp. GXUN7292]|uniref:hypothetical protein n=1 Tax=Paenibacillus sp. GXUN7292 TaxID=3422499 RepID=UPI003D7D8C67
MTVEIGELRARLVAEASQMKQEIHAVKKEFVDLGEQGKKTATGLKNVETEIAKVGSTKDQISKLTATLDNVNARIDLQRKKLAELKESYANTFNEAAKTKLQEQILRTESTLIKLSQSSDNTAQKIWALEDSLQAAGQESQQVASGIETFDQALKDIGFNAEQIKVVKQNLDNLDPGRAERQLEELSATLKRLGVDSQSIEKIKQELRETEVEAQKTTKGINGLSSGLAALGAGAIFSKLVNGVKTLSEETNDLSNSYKGLGNAAKSFNLDAGQAADLADKLADRWGLNKAVMADTVKTYTTLNFSLEETEKIITATADAAAYGRQSHLDWDEAIKKVAEGIKAGNSNLTDSAGITTNLSVMQERYAKSIGTTAGKLTEAQKVQAAYNGMLQEGAIYAGNADEAMTGLTGTQATYQSTLQEVRTELGEAFIPYLERALELITPIIKSFSLWTSENKETVAGLTAAAIAVTGFIAVLSSLAAMLTLVNSLLGPIGWTILGIGSLIAGVTAYSLATNQASESVKEFTANQEQLNKVLSDSSNSMNVNQYKMLQSNLETLNEVLERRNKLEKEYNNLVTIAERGNGSIENTHKIFELADAIKAVDKELKMLDYSSVEEAEFALRGMKQASDEALGALVSLTRENMRENIVLADNVSELKALSEEYDKLKDKTNLTEQQKVRLADAVRKLKQEYPELHVLLDEENRWHIKNKKALEDYISGEENRLNSAVSTSKKVIEAAKIEAEERTRIARENMAELERIEGRGSSTAPFISPTIASFLGKQMETTIDAVRQKLTETINRGNYEINEAKKLLDDLTTGVDAFRRPVENETTSDKKKNGKDKKVKTKEELAREEYQAALNLLEYKKNLNQLSEKQELAALENLEKKYKQYAEIRMDVEVRIYQLKEQMYKREYDDEMKLMQYKREMGQLTEKAELARLEKMLAKYKDSYELRTQLEVQIYRLKEQMAQKDFQHSSEWITQEERRMTLAGESEEAITKMKMEAWTRVRSRYTKDTDYYKQADTQLYNLRVELIRKTEKAEQEAAREQETLVKDALKNSLNAIDKAKRTELSALDERRKAIQAFYDGQAEAINDSERLKERNELVAEMDKYRFATSERGQKKFLELQEKLRQMDIEQQKRNLEKQRDQELVALDRQKKDIETFYDDLRLATEDLTGDLTKLYKLADDERLKSFVATNNRIKQEMAALQQALSAYHSSVSVPSVGSSVSGSTGVNTSKVAQMQANSAAWHTADSAARQRLSAENKAIGTSLGATYNNGEGRWYKDGVPLYHSGGIVGEMNFRSPELLMPDEIVSILRRSETVLTPEQVSGLVEAGQSAGRTINHNYYGPLIENSGDVHLEDDTDVESYYREQDHLVRQMIARGERADG